MQEMNLIRAPHPAYSPDLAPSDFFLFGALKTHMKGRHFTSRDEIKEWVKEMFTKFGPETLKRVFIHWQ
jgi:hypothetical protein